MWSHLPLLNDEPGFDKPDRLLLAALNREVEKILAGRAAYDAAADRLRRLEPHELTEADVTAAAKLKQGRPELIRQELALRQRLRGEWYRRVAAARVRHRDSCAAELEALKVKVLKQLGAIGFTEFPDTVLGLHAGMRDAFAASLEADARANSREEALANDAVIPRLTEKLRQATAEALAAV